MRRTVVTCAVILLTTAAIAGLWVAVGPGREQPSFQPSAAGSAPATRAPAPSVPATRVATTTLAPRPPTTTTNPLGSGRAVTLAFGGDVHFEGVLRPQLDANATGMLSPIAPVLDRADIAMVNLETAITERGEPQVKQFNFRAPPRAFTALRAAGVDVATMANNHGIDYGPTGLTDSLAAARAARFPVVGIGADEQAAYAPWRTTVRGQRIAVIGATQVLDDALIATWTATRDQAGVASAKRVDRLLAAVRAARRSADTVVVYVHWGEERSACPSDAQRTLARQLVAAGADIVVGTHAHRVQGAGRLGAALVAFGLGNFVFYTASGPGTVSGVLNVTVTGRRVDGYSWTPAVIRNGVPRPLAPAEAATAVQQWQADRGCTGLAP